MSAFDHLAQRLQSRSSAPPQRAWPMTWYERLHTTLASLASAAIVIISLLIVVSMFYPYEIVEKMQLAVEGTPRAGGELRVAMDYCVGATPVYRLVVTIQNDITIVLPSDLVRVPPGCHQTHVLHPLPREIPAGTYVLEALVVFRPWPWRTVTYRHYTSPFVIEAAQ